MKDFNDMTRDEQVNVLASDYGIDRSIVEGISRRMSNATFRQLEIAVADEVEAIIAIESGEMVY
jgi:hypothetical protein